VEEATQPEAIALTGRSSDIGNVRTETLTAFGPDEFGKIFGKMP
jgi:uncharacterized protein with GYD domain